MEDLKIHFFTNIHGSCSCFRKFLRFIEEDQVDVLIIGGDITGKKLIPIQVGDKKIIYQIYGKTKKVDKKNLESAKKEISDVGGYPYE